ncbi:hypothetical protein Cgig2_028425 [Carnegiea gigantea]|uniref:DNA-directed DNA polymerase n=1 Tax=Carnegiea gigantea TaxID=171969 RepID=A0A9Q1GHI8_9CARY|nr:hypothetical protein Cgig2_028425 [Carnegiea gigantea]
MQLPSSCDISFTLGKAIPLSDKIGNHVPKKEIYEMIEQLVKLYGEQYQDAVIKGLFIRMYYEKKDSPKLIDFSNDVSSDILTHIYQVMESEIANCELLDVKSLQHKQSRIPTKIKAIKGHLFEKKDSPFKGFVSHFYESRLESKKSSDEAMSYFCKILMNFLYGRFGINPESTVTEICNQKKYEELMKMDNFQCAEKLTDPYYIVNCITNKNSMTDYTEWDPPRMSAVQLSAAITTYDCYYTDTDSVVLGSPLPDELISSTEMDTRLGEIIDLGSNDATTIYISKLLREKAKNPEEVSQSPTEGQKTKPSLYNNKAAAKKAAAKKAKKDGNKDHRPKPDE